MEVAFTSHSHIIGRGGKLINSVMKETMTKIHFPDENRMVGEKKSNAVTIAGELLNVETARRRIRVSAKFNGELLKKNFHQNACLFP